jgi:hypothetical protein
MDGINAWIRKESAKSATDEPTGVTTLVTAPGDGEVTVVTDETMAEKDPLLAKLLAAATAGAEAARPASKRSEIRIVLDPEERPVSKGSVRADPRVQPSSSDPCPRQRQGWP